MPTTRPRFQITETDDLRAALDAAATRWPEDSRSDLVRRLIFLGATSVETELAERFDDWGTRVDAVSGAFTYAYPDGYLDQLRGDWRR